jgi:hypothetical protein
MTAALPLMLSLALNSSTHPTLAMPTFGGVNLQRDEAAFFADHFAQQLRVRGVSVVTAADISLVLGLERQRALLGCDAAGASCIAELASALGADDVITAQIGHFGDTWQLNINVLSAVSAKSIVSVAKTVRGDTELLAALNDAAVQVVDQLGLGHAAAPPPRRALSLIPGVLGVASLGVGLAFSIVAINEHQALIAPQPNLSLEVANRYAAEGPTHQLLGLVGLSVGVVALTAAILWWALDVAPVANAVLGDWVPRLASVP